MTKHKLLMLMVEPQNMVTPLILLYLILQKIHIILHLNTKMDLQNFLLNFLFVVDFFKQNPPKEPNNVPIKRII